MNWGNVKEGRYEIKRGYIVILKSYLGHFCPDVEFKVADKKSVF